MRRADGLHHAALYLATRCHRVQDLANVMRCDNAEDLYTPGIGIESDLDTLTMERRLTEAGHARPVQSGTGDLNLLRTIPAGSNDWA